MSDAPWFPFYPSDFVGGRVATYDLDEIGAFSLLLAFDWTLNGLPTETERLAKLCRVSHRKFLKIWVTIQDQFPERDGRRFNPRLALERAKKGIRSAEASHAAAVRWQSERNADASILHANSDAPTTSVVKESEQVSSTSADAVSRFVAAANRGLAEHPASPQPIPRILVGQATALTATSAILTAGVPVEFAEGTIYELARTHSANDGKVSSLGYFRAAVIRRWTEHLAAVAAQESGAVAPAPSASRSRSRSDRLTPGEESYRAAKAAFEEAP
jgi:uncharacterized protein YdaU (DUF1376 family)